MFNYTTVDDFLAAIGDGGISSHQIATKLASQSEEPKAVTGHTRQDGAVNGTAAGGGQSGHPPGAVLPPRSG